MPKRSVPAFGNPPLKRQAVLPFLATKSKEVAPKKIISTPSSCRLMDYVVVLMKKHRSDERYRVFFEKHSANDITSSLRASLTPATLNVLDNEKEADLDA